MPQKTKIPFKLSPNDDAHANKRDYDDDDDVIVVGIPMPPNWINLHKFSLPLPAYCTLYPLCGRGYVKMAMGEKMCSKKYFLIIQSKNMPCLKEYWSKKVFQYLSTQNG